MGFVSFLKNFGVILGKVALAEAGVVQGVKAADPAASPTVDKLDTMFQSVLATEGMFQAAFPGQQTGPQKLAAAGTLVTPILNEVSVLTGKKIANAAAYQAGVTAMINGMVGMMNAVEGTPVVTTTTITAPAASTSPSPIAPAPANAPPKS
jgi:hypothetical protein